MAWIRRKLRDALVFVRCDDQGLPAVAANGRVEIAYTLQPGARTYRAALRNLSPTGDPDDEIPARRDPAPSGPGAPPPSDPAAAHPSSAAGRKTPSSTPAAIHVYTDGACTGNPGPMGIGIVVLDGAKRKEISAYLGLGTNNIAELSAIQRALQSIAKADRSRPVFLHTDSSYAIGLLSKGWKAKANAQLVAEIRDLAAHFANLQFVKVPAHAGVRENERCDELARAAIASRGR